LAKQELNFHGFLICNKTISSVFDLVTRAPQEGSIKTNDRIISYICTRIATLEDHNRCIFYQFESSDDEELGYLRSLDKALRSYSFSSSLSYRDLVGGALLLRP